MEIINILKRRDAASVVAAVVLALIVESAVSTWAHGPAHWLAGVEGTSTNFRDGFWYPLVLLVIEVLVFELVTRVYIMLDAYTRKK
jgi:hypothetical protein